VLSIKKAGVARISRNGFYNHKSFCFNYILNTGTIFRLGEGFFGTSDFFWQEYLYLPLPSGIRPIRAALIADKVACVQLILSLSFSDQFFLILMLSSEINFSIARSL